jgi:hypothetical protein
LPAHWLTASLVCFWLLMLVTFSTPGREGADSAAALDLIGLAKVGVRLGSIGLLGLGLLCLWSLPERGRVLAALLPFGLFLGWSFLSIGWSAMKTFSFGQALGLMALLELTAVIGLTVSRPQDVSRVLFHLSLGLLVISTILTATDLVRPDLSGLDRIDTSDDSLNGLVHPTSAGATASLGLVLLLGVNILWDWRWARRLLLPGSLMHLILLDLAASRTALGMAAVAVLLLVCCYLDRRLLAGAVVVFCVLGALYLVADTNLDLVRRVKNVAMSKINRDESTGSLSSFNGRTELWEAIWVEVQASPLIGHGYFVTSRTGVLDVWSSPIYRSAHNFLLQVLVSTGLIGLTLFLWALGRLVWVIAVGLSRTGLPGAALRALLSVVGVWYLGWGQLCESFMGPLQPEAVVFYVLVGVGLGAAIPRNGALPAQTDSLPTAGVTHA